MLSRLVVLFGLVFILSGCQLTPPKSDIPPPILVKEEGNKQLDRLLGDTLEVIRQDREAQISACKNAENAFANNKSDETRLKLGLAFAFAAACGDQRKGEKYIRESIQHTNNKQIKQTLELLSFLLNQNLEIAESKRKVNKEYTWLSKKANELREELKTTKSELETIQSKLDQLIEMEQILNQRQ